MTIPQIKKPTLLYGLGVASPYLDVESDLRARNVQVDLASNQTIISFLEDHNLLEGVALEYYALSSVSFTEYEIRTDSEFVLDEKSGFFRILSDAMLTVHIRHATTPDAYGILHYGVVLDIAEGVHARVRIISEASQHRDVCLVKANVRDAATLELNEVIITDQDTFRRSRIALAKGARVYPHHALFSYGEAKVDVKSDVDHYGESSESDMKIRAVVAERSEAITQGDVTIKPTARSSNGYQKEDIILLGDGMARPIPNLEIGNHEVKCSHGATVTNIDEETIFYLTSRGITRKAAVGLVVSSFVNPILTLFSDDEQEAYRQALHGIVDRALR